MKLVDDLIRKIEATTGYQVPAFFRRPLNVSWTLFQDFLRCDLLRQASAMAYVTLLSLVPSLVAIFCVISLFAPLAGKDVNILEEVRAFILKNLASGPGEAAVNQLNEMISGIDLASMGWSAFASVLVTLILLLRQIEEALNRIWLIRKGRNMFARFMYFWTFLTLGMLLLGISLGLSGNFNIQHLLNAGEAAQSGLPGWAVGIAGGFFFFFFLYKIVPNCDVKTANAAIGAIVAAVCLQQATRGFGIYVKNVNYASLYGALATLPLFLMWLYINWIIILLGALISWRMQEGFPHESKEDTLDNVDSPIEQLRNVQVKAVMPLITLVAIYKNFQAGTGHGITGQDLARALKLPISWISDALDALGTMGYIIASKTFDDVTDGPSVTDPYFPAYPAEVLSLWRMQTDLAKPVDEWLREWQHELPVDLAKTISIFNSADLRANPDATFAEALALVPSRA